MSSRQLHNLLKAAKHDPSFGKMSDDALSSGREALLNKVSGDIETPVQSGYQLSDFTEYAWWTFSQTILRPVMVGVGLFVLVIGGSLSSVSASSESVPGDVLYPVKIATERMQLTLASSTEKRAELHIEFADRRLEEITDLRSSENANKNEKVIVAVEKFNEEVTQASTAMQEMVESGEDVIELARAIEQKTDNYENVLAETEADIEASKTEGTEEESVVIEEAVNSAKEQADQVTDAAVDVLVENVENEPESPAYEDVQKRFQKDMLDIDTSVKLTLGRLAVIESTLNNNKDIILAEDVDLNALSSRIQDFSDQVHDAMGYFAAGGFRRAFDVLGAIEAEIDAVEMQVIAIELDIVAQNLASQEVDSLQFTVDQENQADQEVQEETDDKSAQTEEVEGVQEIESDSTVE